MNRREYLKLSAGTMAGGLTLAMSSSLNAMLQESKYKNTIGLQLWTVRNQLAEDRKKTLKAIADAGYKQVEFGDVGQAAELMPICKDLGLNATSSFFNWKSVCDPKAKNVESLDKILEDANQLGLKHLVFGYIAKPFRKTADQYKTYIETCNKFGEKCNASNVKLCYHNHSFEFAKIDGEKTGFDLLIEGFGKQLCQFELDVFWAKIGGWDPFATLKKLDGRVTQVHLKDLKKGAEICHDEGQVPHDAFKELGNGSIDMQKVLQVSEQIGVEQCHVEQDQSPDPIKSIGISLKHFNKLK